MVGAKQLMHKNMQKALPIGKAGAPKRSSDCVFDAGSVVYYDSRPNPEDQERMEQSHESRRTMRQFEIDSGIEPLTS